MKTSSSLYRSAWWILSRIFVFTYLKRNYTFKLVKGSDKFPRPPFLLVANHGTFFDPWFVGGYSRYPLSYMVNDDGFRGKGISQYYLRAIEAIPKKKGASDYKAMKTTLEYLNKGRAVCIFPEGQTTWDGETQLLYKGIEKIIKKKKCPVVVAKLKGNFLAKPWWAETIRKGRILVSMKVISPSQIENYSSDELFEYLKESLYHNDITDPDNQSVTFTGERLAEGLERFVWVCVKCRTEDSLVTSGNNIRCTECGSSWNIDEHCRIMSTETGEVSDLHKWSLAHKKFVKEKLQTIPDQIITSSKDVLFQVENETLEFEDKCSGTLTLTSGKLSFSTTNENFSWYVQDIQDCVIQKKDIFEFCIENRHYRFVFNKKSPMKWIYYLRYLKGFEEAETRGYL